MSCVTGSRYPWAPTALAAGPNITINTTFPTSAYGTTTYTITGSSGSSPTLPGGITSSVQINYDGTHFTGSQYLMLLSSTGQLNHLGTPVHQEVESVFRDVSGSAGTVTSSYGEARSKWSVYRTTNTASVTLQSINIPASSWGDCFVTAIFEVTVAGSTGGGNISHKATYRRASGSLLLINDTNYGNPGDLQVSASVTASISGNDSIILSGRGLSTPLNWVISTHFQVATVS